MRTIVFQALITYIFRKQTMTAHLRTSAKAAAEVPHNSSAQGPTTSQNQCPKLTRGTHSRTRTRQQAQSVQHAPHWWNMQIIALFLQTRYVFSILLKRHWGRENLTLLKIPLYFEFGLQFFERNSFGKSNFNLWFPQNLRRIVQKEITSMGIYQTKKYYCCSSKSIKGKTFLKPCLQKKLSLMNYSWVCLQGGLILLHCRGAICNNEKSN